jgi:malate synthase
LFGPAGSTWTRNITEQGFHRNIDVPLQDIKSWLRGGGCVPIYNLMEDAATAEISRAQLWQWIRYSARLEDGRKVTMRLVADALGQILDDTNRKMAKASFLASKFQRAADLLLVLSEGEFQEFLTTSAYADLQ